MYGGVVTTSCIEIRGYCEEYERFFWVKIYGILSLFTHELYFFGKITYLHTELQRKKIDLLRTRKGLVVLDLRVYIKIRDSFFHRSKNLRYFLSGNYNTNNPFPAAPTLVPSTGDLAREDGIFDFFCAHTYLAGKCTKRGIWDLGTAETPKD